VLRNSDWLRKEGELVNNPLFDLAGRNALVTGSSRGLGRALARGFAEAGACVVLNGRDEARLDRTVSELRAEGHAVCGYAFDVCSSSAIADAVTRIEDEVGQIDILMNNAGTNIRGPLHEFEEDTWREVIDTNLTSIFLVTKQVVKGMIDRCGGKIINMGSLTCEVGRETTAAYTTSKGGVRMLTRGMAVDWARYNIQVNAIGPGYFITDLTRPLADNPEFDAWIKKRTPAGRWGDPAELVGAAVFLASDASAFVNGQVIYVDGGILASL
jgi:gluconate 5-dehydrogenase